MKSMNAMKPQNAPNFVFRSWSLRSAGAGVSPALRLVWLAAFRFGRACAARSLGRRASPGSRSFGAPDRIKNS
jgi:hypothetical protein